MNFNTTPNHFGEAAVPQKLTAPTRAIGGITTALKPITPVFIPRTLRGLLNSSAGSAAGYSAISGFLTCPEAARLRAAGVRQRSSGDNDPTIPTELSALDFGTLIHVLRAIRLTHSPETVYQVLDAWLPEMLPTDYDLAHLLMRGYDSAFPRESDALEYLAVEAEVITYLGESATGLPILRSVRYDTVVRVDGQLYSFEAKTMSRSGPSSLQPYIPQGMCQVAIWNNNPALVAAYGPMRGVIWDCYVKTALPKLEREGPQYFSTHQQQMAVEYLRSPEAAVYYSKSPDGSYPRMLHACWGRWRPCEYINLCHDQVFGDYEIKGQPYQGE